MGSIVSSAFPSAASAAESSSTSSRVQAFHSPSEWKSHVSSLKNNSSVLMVIDFTASWCGPCKFMEPAFIDLSNKFTHVVFVKIDVDELRDVAQEFGVQAMPTFVLVKDGKQVDQVVGTKKDELRKKIEKHATAVAAM